MSRSAVRRRLHVRLLAASRNRGRRSHERRRRRHHEARAHAAAGRSRAGNGRGALRPVRRHRSARCSWRARPEPIHPPTGRLRQNITVNFDGDAAPGTFAARRDHRVDQHDAHRIPGRGLRSLLRAGFSPCSGRPRPGIARSRTPPPRPSTARSWLRTRFKRYRGLEIAADSPTQRDRREVVYHFVGDLALTETSSAGSYARAAHTRDRRYPRQWTSANRGRRLRPVPARAPSRTSTSRGCAGGGSPICRAVRRRRPRRGARRAPDARARRRREDRRAQPPRVSRALELARIGAGDGGADRLWTAVTRHPTCLVGIVRPRPVLDRLIGLRVRRELEDGLVAELEAALATPGNSRSALQIIGVREIMAMRDGTLERARLPDALAVRTRPARQGTAHVAPQDPRRRRARPRRGPAARRAPETVLAVGRGEVTPIGGRGFEARTGYSSTIRREIREVAGAPKPLPHRPA